MSQGTFKTIKTVDGVVLHTYNQEGKNPVPHSLDGPAIKYPRDSKRKDEYFIFGIAYTKEKWLEVKEDAKVKYMPIDPKLEG